MSLRDEFERTGWESLTLLEAIAKAAFWVVCILCIIMGLWGFNVIVGDLLG